jgi:hypothetical protein
MKHLKRYNEAKVEFNESTDIRDILSEASDMGAVVKIEYKWTKDTTIKDTDEYGTYDRAHNTELLGAHRIYKIEIEFETKDLSLSKVSDIMKEMDDVSHKLKIVSDEYKVEWMLNRYGSDDTTERDSQILRFVIYIISTTEVAQTDPIANMELVIRNFFKELPSMSVSITRLRDVVKVIIMDMSGSPRTIAQKDALDRKRYRVIKKIHKALSDEIYSKLGYDVKEVSDEYSNWGVSKVGAKRYPYFFVKISDEI